MTTSNFCRGNPKQPALLSIQNVTVFYDQFSPILRNASFEMMSGEKNVLLGPSGSGKTTLLALASGTMIPQYGQVVFNGRALAYAERELQKHWRHCPLIDQDAKSLLPFHTVGTNIAKALILAGLSRRAAWQEARKLLDVVGLTRKEHSRPDELSGGERQRAVIAKALSMDGQLLLADEPVSSLDGPNARLILKLLKELPCGVLLVTHQVELVIDFCDRIFVLCNQRLTDITNVKHENRRLLTTFDKYVDLVEESDRLRHEKEKAALSLQITSVSPALSLRRGGRRISNVATSNTLTPCKCAGVREPIEHGNKCNGESSLHDRKRKF